MPIETGAKLIRVMEQCTRCGWVNPAALDRWAEQSSIERMDAASQRAALAASGEPFTFVQSSDVPLSVREALSQALAAATMLGTPPDVSRAQRIFQQMYAYIGEVLTEETDNMLEAERKQTLNAAVQRVKAYGQINMPDVRMLEEVVDRILQH
jgi:hypothetical protein